MADLSTEDGTQPTQSQNLRELNPDVSITSNPLQLAKSEASSEQKLVKPDEIQESTDSRNEVEGRAEDSGSVMANGSQPDPAQPSAAASDSLPQSALAVNKIRNDHHRLRSVIQPGDDGRGPMGFSIFAIPAPAQLPAAVTRRWSKPKQESDMESSVNSKEAAEHSPTEAEVEKEPPPSRNNELSKEVALASASVTKKSLEDNNRVYKLIQAENEKRQNSAGDGSVQAVVVTTPEHKHVLRHMTKRDILREDGHSIRISMPSSVGDSSRKSRVPTSTTLPGDSDTAFTSPDSSPTHRKATKVAPEPDGVAPPTEAPLNSQTIRSALPNTSASILPAGQSQPGRQHSLKRSVREKRLERELPKTQDEDAPPAVIENGHSHPAVFHDSPTLPQEDSLFLPKLRRSSHGSRLENNAEIRRTSLNRGSQRASRPLEEKLERAASDLTREGLAIADADSTSRSRASGDQNRTVSEPIRESFQAQSLRPIQSPLSVSRMSDRSDIELCEARGVEIYPQNNDSLRLVQQRFAPDPERTPYINSSVLSDLDKITNGKIATVAAADGPDDPVTDFTTSEPAPDSPFMRQGAAPKPPMIKFIPPTPNKELEHLDGSPDQNRQSIPLRRATLNERTKRYNGGLAQQFALGRAGSQRKRGLGRSTSMPTPRPTHLSSSWQRRDNWPEFDSDESDPDDFHPLPAGGDTSDITETKRNLFPRKMSVRMPGFRGTGGFLVGNSLGIDRHGSNNRRHYIDAPLSNGPSRHPEEEEEEGGRRIFTVPFSGGVRVEYVGLEPLRTRLREINESREQRALEKRRQKLRKQIGTRLYHDGPNVTP